MIYKAKNFLFIHIPRTGGVAIKATLASAMIELGNGLLVGDSWFPHRLRRHARASELKKIIPGWDDLFKFAFVRNPWTAVVSDYMRMKTYPLPPPDGPQHEVVAQLRNDARRARSTSFQEWVLYRLQYLAPGSGYWRYWCCQEDGQNLGIEPMRFENLTEEWERIAERLGIPGTPLKSANGVPHEPVAWTQPAIEFVRERCADDFERFGYPMSP